MDKDRRKKQILNYLDKLEQIVIHTHKDGRDGVTRDQIYAAAAAADMSANQFIIQCIKEKLDK